MTVAVPPLKNPCMWTTAMAIVVAAFGVGVSGAYLIVQVARASRQTQLLTEQARMVIKQTAMIDKSLHDQMEDHKWMIDQQERLMQLEAIVRVAVDRKESLIRGALKRLCGWTDADIEAVIQGESGGAGNATATPPAQSP